MIKKYNKILFTTLLFFLLLLSINITTVSAKEVTLDELAEKVIEVKPDTTYLYIIGEYAFTSDHILTTQDIMLAARSIEVSANGGETNNDAIYNEMTIMYVEGTYDSEWNLNGLEYVSNLVGTTEPGETFEIKYIDYDGEVFNKIDVDKLVDEAYKTIDTTTANDKFEVSKEGNTISVTILDNSMNSVEALSGTGIATAAENLLNEYGIKKVTLAIPGTETSVEITAENLLEKLGELDALFAELAGTTNAVAGDLAGKSITVTLGLEEGCTTEDTTTFTVIFDKKEVEVSELVDEAYNTIDTTTANDKFEVSKEGNTIKVTVLDNNMNSVEALSGTGIATAAENLLNEYGVKSVTLAIPGTSVEVTAENLLEKLGELDTLFIALAGKENAVAGDLAGKSITVTLGLEDGCTTEDATTFTVTFDKKEVEVSELVDEAFNTIDTTASNEKFEVEKGANNTIKVTVLDNNMNSIEALSGTGIATAAENLLNEYGVKSVTLAIPGTSVEVTAENLLENLDDLYDLFIALAGKENAVAGDLAGKSITITLGLEEGCTTEDVTTFTVTFDKKEVEVEELVNEVFNTIDTTASNEKFEVEKGANNTIKVTVLDNNMNSIEALSGTGIATAAENLLNEYGVKSVTLAIPGTSVEVTAENLLEKLGELDTLFIALAGKENAVAGDLAGKSITITLGLEEGCTTEDVTTFTVTFDKKEEVTVSTFVDSVYNTIDTTTNSKFEVLKSGDTINVTILEAEMDSVTALGGTGIVAAAENLLNEESVKTVTLSISETQPSVVVSSADELILKIGEFDALFTALAGKENAQASDLAGKSITVTIELEEGYTSKDSTSFTVSFN